MSASELVDVVDADDRVLKQATRGEARRQNLRHRATYILVFNDAGQLFVHQRTHTKDIYPGYFDVCVGGVLAAGESYEDGARRELCEEIGVADVPLRRLVSFQFADGDSQVNGVVFSCTYEGPLKLQAEEIIAGEFLDLDVVLERISTQSFCPDGVEALCRYLDCLERARAR